MMEEPRIDWNTARAPVPSKSGQAPPNVVMLLLTSLRQHLLSIMICGLLGLMAAYLFNTVARPRFEATAELLVDPRDLVVLDKEVTPRSSASDTGIAVVESQARVLQSDVVLRRALATLKLDEDEEFNGTRKGIVARTLSRLFNYDPPGAEAVDPKLAALRTLRQRIWVKRSERTFVIDLTVWTETSAKSVALAEAIIKSYLEEQAAARSDPALAAGAAIDSGLEGLRQKLAESEEKTARYKSEKNLIGSSGKLVTEQQVTEINTQLVSARSELGRTKARYDEAQRLRNKPDAIPEALASATLRQLRNQLSTVVSQKAKLSATLKPQHPLMVQVLEQERQLQSEIREELQRVIASATVDYERARAVEKGLSSDFETLRIELNTVNSAQIKLRELERELEANRAVYQSAIVRARETREQARLNTSNVRVLAEPTPQRDRSFPPSAALTLPLGLLVGLGAGAFFGLLRDGAGWRETPKAASLIAQTRVPAPVTAPMPAAVSVPVPVPAPARFPSPLAAAQRKPFVPIANRTPATAKPVLPPRSRLGSPASRAAEIEDQPYTFTNLRSTLNAAFNAPLAPTPEEEALVVFDLASSTILAPNTGVGRKLNRLTAHLESIRPLDREPHVVIVTSDLANPMASVVALGLAYASHARKKRVLLVDADVDDGSLSAALPNGRRIGTQDVLSGLAPLSVATIKVPGKTPNDSAQPSTFDCLTTTERTVRSNRSRVNQTSLRRILVQAKDYDVVVIKAPALDSTSVDASFSEVACQVLLAMRVAPASEDVLLGAMQTLRKAVPKFCGLVITD